MSSLLESSCGGGGTKPNLVISDELININDRHKYVVGSTVFKAPCQISFSFIDFIIGFLMKTTSIERTEDLWAMWYIFLTSLFRWEMRGKIWGFELTMQSTRAIAG